MGVQIANLLSESQQSRTMLTHSGDSINSSFSFFLCILLKIIIATLLEHPLGATNKTTYPMRCM